MISNGGYKHGHGGFLYVSKAANVGAVLPLYPGDKGFDASNFAKPRLPRSVTLYQRADRP
jgi:hypothetical protein